MKKWLTVLISIIGLASVAQAQDDLNPDALFPIADLEISLPVMSNWSYREADGVYFAASDTDLDLATDGDPFTVPTALVMQLSAITVSNLGARDDTPLEDLNTAIVNQLGIIAQEAPLSSSVLGHHALTIFGSINGAGVALSIWTQDDKVLMLSLTIPDAAAISFYAQQWGSILGNITATLGHELDRKVTSTYGFEVAYPQAFTPLNFEQNGLFGLFENAEDAQLVASGAGTSNVTGASFVVTLNSFDNLGLNAQSTPTDLQTVLLDNLGLEKVLPQGEFYVDGNVGTGFYGVIPNGRWLYVVGTLDTENEIVLFYMLTAASEDILLEVIPTYYGMLHSTNQNLSNISG